MVHTPIEANFQENITSNNITRLNNIVVVVQALLNNSHRHIHIVMYSTLPRKWIWNTSTIRYRSN